MTALLLGLVALIVLLIFARGLSGPSSATFLRGLAILGGILALAIAVAFILARSLTYAIPFATLGLWLLSRAVGQNYAPHRSASPDSKTSSVVTEHLEMELNLDTGDMNGRVRKGRFAGATIEQMSPAQLAMLWQECRFSDPQSAQLLEAYLDRIYPDWREDMAQSGRGGASGSGSNGRMTVAEAYEILGLEPNATKEQIRRAHKELMLKMHPDRGGSSYLAAKINEAKDILLQSKRPGDA